jgi:hypothetical protein
MAKKIKDNTEETRRITLRDFKSWLSGVEDMQEDGWTPTADQWERIRSKINLIDDTITSIEVAAGTKTLNAPTHRNVTEPMKNFPAAAPQPPMMSSALDMALTPVVAATTLPPSMATGNDGKIKTPDISTPGYNRSQFA